MRGAREVDDGAACLLRRNKLHDNESIALHITDFAHPMVVDNVFADNEQAVLVDGAPRSAT